ncbi:LysM peptidoglycan-binding domain-containing protein [Aquirufa rosea]|uniref:LysM peptidoglycan-binding domain-containing protein n=1 Tax=Aquirufa rosea TaxID=2509241 RepID=A0A4Q1C2Q0_9BACT|nr:LysM peptidoglycan-binding domain-containing protein [Aquirufa rosea]RXK52468.1 LysM peptidoglycan-binding domain-containing protein [Aquirufa rosea]
MIQKKLLFLFLWLSCYISNSLIARTPTDTLSLGNLKVAVHPSAKSILEKEWAMLGANKKFVGMMKEKMRLFFPLIEPILKEGNIPEDFKYLCVQESSLNPNAVSTSNAVGYWQFKLETAKDVGLRVNKEVDERRHIMEATKGAVNYLSRNNTVLDNWLSTLLSYRLGLGTLKKMPLATDWSGKSLIEVDSSTDWYVLRFLAYKHFWETELQLNSEENNTSAAPSMITYTQVKGKNLMELSDEWKVSYDDLKKYNSWVLKDWVPEDKEYTLYHPSNVSIFESKGPVSMAAQNTVLTASIDTNKLYVEKEVPQEALYPKKKHKPILSDKVEMRWHTVEAGESLTSIAKKYDMKLPDLVKINGLDMSSTINLGQKIKVSRKIPMLELIAEQLDEKAKKEPVMVNTPTERIEKIEKPEKTESDEPKVRIKSNTGSDYIDPAVSREITIRSENSEKDYTPSQTTPVENPISKAAEKISSSLEIKAISIAREKTNSTSIHLVKSGETLFRIASQYGITVQNLLDWNKLGKNPKIQVGQQLKVKP